MVSASLLDERIGREVYENCEQFKIVKHEN